MSVNCLPVFLQTLNNPEKFRSVHNYGTAIASSLIKKVIQMRTTKSRSSIVSACQQNSVPWNIISPCNFDFIKFIESESFERLKMDKYQVSKTVFVLYIETK